MNIFSAHNTINTASNDDAWMYVNPNMLDVTRTIGRQWNHFVNRMRTMLLMMPLCIGIREYRITLVVQMIPFCVYFIILMSLVLHVYGK